MDAIARWRQKGLLLERRAALLAAIEDGRLFSVADELSAMLYLGALLLIAGVSATVKQYFQQLGRPAIVAALGGSVLACLAYCESRSRPYSDGPVESPTPGFDYILFIGCALVGVLFAYLESQFHWLGDNWDLYLLASSLCFLYAAYRFDNRMVLAMGLLNLGGCIAVRAQRYLHADTQMMRHVVMAEGAVACAVGLSGSRSGVKAHFEDTYLSLGINAMLAALISDPKSIQLVSPSLLLILLICGACIAFATTYRRFAYFLYGVGYGYAAVAIAVAPHLSGISQGALFFLVSAGAAVAAILAFRKSLEAKE